MEVEIRTKGQSAPAEKPFPKLMINRRTGTVLLATGIGTCGDGLIEGTVIKRGPLSPDHCWIGRFHDNWSEEECEHLTPDEEVILRNS